MKEPAFSDCYRDVPVLVTGDTGFKGAWLSIWLRELGARVVGYSLPPLAHPNLYALTDLAEKIHHVDGDLHDSSLLSHTIKQHQPRVIFHLAAQAIVLQGYEEPVDTFATNVMGTIHLLEAIRSYPSVRAVVIVTTDKCYENREWSWGYRESDVLGGHDPYSASKAMAELAVASYRHSFFSRSDSTAIATARAGNVIGGGDFSIHRIIPDLMRALLNKQLIQVRNPASVRPWMHVLDPLNGYLSLAAHLLKNGQAYAQAWNFGPCEPRGISVQELVEKAIEFWGEGDWVTTSQRAAPEKNILRLNWDKAAQELSWKPNYHWQEAVQETVEWFKAYQRQQIDSNFSPLYETCVQHIEQYNRKILTPYAYAV